MSDDDLHEFDLSAWEVPAPKPDLADAVIARMSGAAAVETEPTPRRWPLFALAGALVAGAAIAGAIVMSGSHRTPPARGEVVATRAMHVDLDTLVADLDPGAWLAWRRDSHGITVEQRGTITYRVGAGEQLRIETDAAVAPVEASGASLRVEAHMNLADVRVLGASAMTAAAVAFVTVVVYEGHVRVGGAHSVAVEAGAAVTLAPNQPPQPVDLVALQDRVKLLEQQLAAGTPARDDDTPPPDEIPPQKTPTPIEKRDQVDDHKAPHKQTADDCDETSCVLDDIPGDCCKKYKRQQKGPGDKKSPREIIQQTMAAARPKLLPCIDHDAKLDIHMRVTKAGNVSHVVMAGNDITDAESACLHKTLDNLVFKGLDEDTTFSYPLIFSGKAPPKKVCDAANLADIGRRHSSNGEHADALDSYLESLACKTDPAVKKLAFIAACRAGNAAKATELYDEGTMSTLVQVCVQANPPIDPRAACDADLLASKGVNESANGAHYAALGLFKASLKCRRDADVQKLAFLAACRAGSAADAKALYDANTMKDVPQECVNKAQVDPPSEKRACLEASRMLRSKSFTLAVFYTHARRCKSDPDIRKLAFEAACRAGKAEDAKELYDHKTMSTIVEACLQNKPPIDPRTDEERACSDASEMLQQQASLGIPEVFYTNARKCTSDRNLRKLAFMAACRAGRADDAKALYNAATMSGAVQACLTQKPPIDPR